MRKKMSEGNRIAKYFRMSDDIQEKSIDRQQAEVNPYCLDKKYLTVEECLDKGISGTETTKRKGLQRLIALAEAGLIDGIVVDDLDRLVRLDLLELGEFLAPLRRAGVWIESVSQGRFDYNSQAGRLILGITSESKNGQVVDTARRCLTQHLRMARDTGKPPLAKPAYGYRRVEDLDRPAKPDGRRHGKYVIVAEEAEIVLAIFTWYAKEWTPGQISDELFRRSVPSPTGKPRWRRATIRAMLANHAYIGDRAWGKCSSGKHFTQIRGAVVAGDGVRRNVRNPREEWLIGTETHQPILTDRDLWQKVQGRLIRSETKEELDQDGVKVRMRGEASTPSTDPGEFVLSRLLVCGACESWLTGYNRPVGKKEVAYCCSKYMAFATAGCQRCEVREAVAVQSVIAELRRLLAPERQGILRKRLKAHMQTMRSDGNVNQLRKRWEELKAQEARYKRRLLECSKDMLSEVEDAIRSTRAQVEEARQELDQVERLDPVADLERTIEAATAAIWKLEKALEDGDRIGLKEALRGTLGKIIMRSSTYETLTGKTRRKPASFEVVLLRGTGLDLLADLDGSPSRHVQVLHVPIDPLS